MKKQKTLEQGVKEIRECLNPAMILGRVANCSMIALRDRPSFNGKPLRILPIGTMVTILDDCIHQFVQVRYYSNSVPISGYIDRRYLKVDD